MIRYLITILCVLSILSCETESRISFSDTEVFYIKDNMNIDEDNNAMDSIPRYYDKQTSELITGKIYKNSKLVAEVVNGQIIGKHELWNDDGVLILSETFENNLRNGLYQSWFSDGTPHFKIDYIAGKIDGRFQEVREDDGTRIEATYLNGKKNGIYKEFFKNGDLAHSVNYSNNLRNGKLYSEVTLVERGTGKILERKKKEYFTSNYVMGKLEGQMIWRDIETDGVIRLWTYANDVKDGPEYWFREPCIDVTTNSKGETFVVNQYNCDLFISNINKNGETIVGCAKNWTDDRYLTWYGSMYGGERLYSDRCYTYSGNQVRQAKAEYN
jgi:antitoxin component YwqK of YwqJK toxin-antitoxin module